MTYSLQEGHCSVGLGVMIRFQGFSDPIHNLRITRAVLACKLQHTQKSFTLSAWNSAGNQCLNPRLRLLKVVCLLEKIQQIQARPNIFHQLREMQWWALIDYLEAWWQISPLHLSQSWQKGLMCPSKGLRAYEHWSVIGHDWSSGPLWWLVNDLETCRQIFIQER